MAACRASVFELGGQRFPGGDAMLPLLLGGGSGKSRVVKRSLGCVQGAAECRGVKVEAMRARSEE